ncbi:chondroitinase-B domain-containing protein [Dokdonella sp.]|uniref:chondroitinase-B domain-containing protein n=1 Tax=Dokdonella sp. TaxID=2291710 RepID=UPI0027BA3120|nr:chondroitinase-B domain-containing protein [Dokdonella sp.]
MTRYHIPTTRLAILMAALVPALSSAGGLPLGTLIHDGPATPEQLSLYLPLTAALPTTARASVQYRVEGAPTWREGHPLHRIRPDFAQTPGAGSVPDAFAWPLIDLVPGTRYEVEVTVTSGAESDVRSGLFTTRSLPAAAGAPNKFIASGSSLATIQAAMNALNPGDVIQFADGVYTLGGNIQLSRSGTAAQPIVIRGATRNGVVLARGGSGRVIQVLDANHVVLENMTLQGSGVDSGTAASSTGIGFWSGAPSQTDVVVRQLTIRGVDVGIKAYAELREFLAYDNTLLGNNTWTADLITTNATWNDDGLCIPGFGNAAFNNTLRGFGDSLAYTVDGAEAVGVHFYRNEIISTGDDTLEADYAHRNLTFYDNRAHNAATLLSLDPLYGGPLLAARNISINTQRSPFKFNNTNTGQFVYNNTIIRTTGNGSHANWAWAQFNNGQQRAWGYRNNVLLYQGTGNLLAFEAGGNDPIDFDHNAWYPDGAVWWSNSGGSYPSLAAAAAGVPVTTPLYGTATRRHDNDVLTTVNPWTTPITLGATFLTEILAIYLPTPAAGWSIKNSGIAIAGISDGFLGAAPDRGAVIEGRMPVAYGDRSVDELFADGFEQEPG